MWDNIKKIIGVVALTFLIWTWAYLALEEEVSESGTLDISPATSPHLLVTFVDRNSPVPLKLNIKGSTAKIADFRKKLLLDQSHKDRETLEFLYNPQTENHDQPKTYSLNMLEFLNRSSRMKRLGLSVEFCEPETVDVKVEELVEKMLDVQCVDENNAKLTPSFIEPSRVKMYVRKDWAGDLLTAVVKLTPARAAQARETTITERPYVELVPGKPRFARTTVQIKLAPPEQALQDRVLPAPAIGYVFSQNLKGKYTVELANPADFNSIRFRAADDAFEAYKAEKYQINLEIHDEDEQQVGQVIQRSPTYNFPHQYITERKIGLSGPLPIAKFKLIKVPSTAPAE